MTPCPRLHCGGMIVHGTCLFCGRSVEDEPEPLVVPGQYACMWRGREGSVAVNGDRIKKLRTERKWRGCELARRAHIAESTVRRLEGGKVGAGPIVLSGIAGALGVDVAELVAP
jgi:DNA-binding Xre family transcriptional regulator